MNLTLAQVLERLHTVHQDMAAAQRQLAKARDAEVAALEDYTVAKARAILSPDCPRPKRGENGVTVADRDAWVVEQTTGQRAAAMGAEAYRKAAEDALRVARDQASVVQSLASLMRAEIQLASTAQ